MIDKNNNGKIVIEHGYQPVGDDSLVIEGYIPSGSTDGNVEIMDILQSNPPLGGSSQQDK